MKYNLALIPTQKSANFVSLALNFSNISSTYLLGENSLPHITLYAFQDTESNIQQHITAIDTALNSKTLTLKLNEFSYITFDKHIFWISLLPDNKQILRNMHQTIAQTLNLPTKISFDPHLTLTNTLIGNYHQQIEEVKRVYEPIEETFKLALGLSDDVGQIIKITHSF